MHVGFFASLSRESNSIREFDAILTRYYPLKGRLKGNRTARLSWCRLLLRREGAVTDLVPITYKQK